MIELEITRPYKSFAPVSTRINLPDFVVISGINGSGKTQLLEAIGNLNIGVWDGQKQVKAIKYVAPGGLVVSDSPIASYYTLRVKIDEAIESYNRSVRPRMDEAAFDRHFGKSEAGRFIKAVAKNAGKNINQLDEGDFRRHAPLEPNLDKRDIFGHELSTLCKAYHVKYLENAFHRFRNRTEGIAYEYLEDERFFELYGEKPWTFMNKVLERARLDFYLDFDEKLDRDSAYQVKLVSRISGATVTIAELSSGEKVLMALALAIYNSGVGVQFPELLVMDEPDAHLHPSMTKQFIDVVDHLFVREKGMKVIVTTHSPSTVALAPAESIYVMQRVEPRLLKRGKDEALRNLTAGVPTLSINYENRKQVFVESNNDVFFYDRIYEKLKPYLTPEISLSFISSGVGGQGNCDQVKEIVNTLNKFGNHSVYGIIDWDLKNNGNDHVRVLGKDRRYSIENYLFDPILTALFLLREKSDDLEGVWRNYAKRSLKPIRFIICLAPLLIFVALIRAYKSCAEPCPSEASRQGQLQVLLKRRSRRHCLSSSPK